MKNLIVACSLFLFSAPSYACKLTQPGYANLIVGAAMNEFVENADNATVVKRIVLNTGGYVDIRFVNRNQNLRSLFQVNIGADCSTKVKLVKTEDR